MPRKALLGAALVAATLGCTNTAAHAQVFGARPAIDSAQALDVRTTAAKLQASVRFNEKAGTWWFSYCRLSDCANGEQETPHQDDNPETDAEAIAARTVEWPVNALTPATQYRVTVHAGNDTHAFDPTTRTFTFTTATPSVPAAPVAPVATTDAPTAIAPTTTTLSGTAVPGTTGGTGVGSSAFFEWGPANGALNQTTPAQSMPADANPYPISAGLSGLAPGQRYSYRLVVMRGNQRVAGAIRTWQTTPAPNCANATTTGSAPPAASARTATAGSPTAPCGSTACCSSPSGRRTPATRTASTAARPSRASSTEATGSTSTASAARSARRARGR